MSETWRNSCHYVKSCLKWAHANRWPVRPHGGTLLIEVIDSPSPWDPPNTGRATRHRLARVELFPSGTGRHLDARSEQGSAGEHQAWMCPPVRGSPQEPWGGFRFGGPSPSTPSRERDDRQQVSGARGAPRVSAPCPGPAPASKRHKPPWGAPSVWACSGWGAGQGGRAPCTLLGSLEFDHSPEGQAPPLALPLPQEHGAQRTQLP